MIQINCFKGMAFRISLANLLDTTERWGVGPYACKNAFLRLTNPWRHNCGPHDIQSTGTRFYTTWTSPLLPFPTPLLAADAPDHRCAQTNFTTANGPRDFARLRSSGSDGSIDSGWTDHGWIQTTVPGPSSGCQGGRCPSTADSGSLPFQLILGWTQLGDTSRLIELVQWGTRSHRAGPLSDLLPDPPWGLPSD